MGRLDAYAEDTLFDDEACAKRIAYRISNFKEHYDLKTVLLNAADLIEYLNRVRNDNASITDAYLESSSYSAFTDISMSDQAIIKLQQNSMSGPWLDASVRFPKGTTCNGIIVNRHDIHGLFVEIDNASVTGLLHKSRLPTGYEFNDRFLPGETIVIKIRDIDPVRQKIALEFVPELLL